MPGYLPLSAFRQGLLPTVCQTCVWWQTTGNERLSAEAAAEKRRHWMASVESTWGATGLLLEADESPPSAAASSGHAGEPVVIGSISFAPAGAVPRLRAFPFSSLTAGSALLFCLWLEEGQPRTQAKRLLQKALGQLKSRGVMEVFAVAGSFDPAVGDANGAPNRCAFLSADFLAANGFEPVMESGELVLMRADLRGLLSLVGQVETAVRRVLHREPTPSPAAWTRKHT